MDSLLSSTLIGGSGTEYGYSITFSDDSIFVAGYTASQNFPTTDDAYQTSRAGGYDVFISALSTNLDALVASTYLGGSSQDYCYDIVIDENGEYLYFTCGTRDSATDYPTNSGYDTTHNGDYDVFVTKFQIDLSGSDAL